MIKIYFDDKLVEENDSVSIGNLTNDFEIFSNEFYLGATPSNTYQLSIRKRSLKYRTIFRCGT